MSARAMIRSTTASCSGSEKSRAMECLLRLTERKNVLSPSRWGGTHARASSPAVLSILMTVAPMSASSMVQ